MIVHCVCVGRAGLRGQGGAGYVNACGCRGIVPFWALKKLKTPRPGITQFNKIYISGLWPDSRPLARLAAVGQIRGLWLDSRPLPDSQHLAVHAGQEVQQSLAYMMHSFDCVTNALPHQRDRHHPTPPPPQHITTPGPTYSNVCVFEFGFLLGWGGWVGTTEY